MKLKPILLSLSITLSSLFASIDAYVPVYIPMYDQQSNSGVTLNKVLFYTNYSAPEANIDAVTWSYKINSPHKRYNGKEGNLAHIKGLKVTLDNYTNNKNCSVTIDSSRIINHNPRQLNTILNYVTEATRLNLKESQLECKIITIREKEKSYPKPLALQKSIVKAFKPYQSNIAEAQFAYDDFYPLGYSRDGKKIAYIIEHNTDPADIIYIETFIQDLVTDKIVWRDIFKKNDYRHQMNFKTFWNERGDVINKKLAHYKITPKENIKLRTPLFYYNHDVYSLSTKRHSYFSQDWNREFLDTSNIYIHSKYKGSKEINKKRYKKDMSHILDRKAIGFIDIGKRRKRVAILVASINRGWEGPPHNIRYEVIGANLDVKFKQ